MTSGAARPKLLFLGAFPPPGSGVVGGNVTDCEALLASSFSQRFELLLVDNSDGANEFGFLRRLGRACLRAAKFVRLLHANRPDAVFLLASYGFGFFEKSLLVVYARAFGVPSLLSIRSGHFIDECHRSVAFRAAAWVLLRAPARLVCQGRRWQELFRDRFGLGAERCPVVDAWVATKELLEIGQARGGAPRRPLTLIFLGSLVRAKGIYELLEAFARLRSDPTLPELVLVVVGEGPERAELGRWVEERGVAGAVRFPGLLLGAAKARALAEADLFVLPSYTEGLPNAMIEAMAAGLPVIVTPVGSIPDVIVQGENGCLVPARDPAALEVVLRDLINSPETCARMGREAHRVAEARFSPEQAAARLEALVREVSGPHREDS